MRDFSYDNDRCRAWVGDLPRNLACLTNAAISIIRCQSWFAYVPEAYRHQHYAGRRARRVSLAVSALAAKAAKPPGPFSRPACGRLSGRARHLHKT